MDGIEKACTKRFWLGLAAVASVAFGLRMGLRLWTGAADYWQSGYSFYRELADSLVAGHGYAFSGEPPTAFRVPLYPLLIAAVTTVSRSPWLFLAVQALVSCGTVVCAGLLARRLFGSAAGLGAATICALYPYYAWHDLALQETGLITFLTALATLLLIGLRRRRLWPVALAAGLALGCAILTRATLAPFAAFAVLWLALPSGDGGRLWRRLAGAGIVAAACLAALSPWLIRAESLTGAPGLGTEFGAALYAGNHRLTFSAYPERSIDESRARIFASLTSDQQRQIAALGENEAKVDAWFARAGWEEIVTHPARTAIGGMRKLWAAFGPWPSPRHGVAADLAYAAVWSILLVLGCAGLWLDRANWRRDSLFYVHFATFCAISAALWAHTSHRAYLDVYLMVFAAGAVGRMVRSDQPKRAEAAPAQQHDPGDHAPGGGG